MTLLKLPSLQGTKQSLHNQVDELAGDCFVPRNDELNSATIWENKETAHVHVTKGAAAGKLWLEPDIEIAYLHGFTNSKGKTILNIIESNAENTKAILRQKISVYPRLEKATSSELNNFELIANGTGIHWPSADEDVSLKGFLQNELRNVVIKDSASA